MPNRMQFIFERLIGGLLALCLASFVGLQGAFAESGQFVVARDGAPSCVILIAPEAPQTTLDAAHELNLWVSKVTGAELPIVTIDEWDGEAPYIAVGESKVTQANGWSSRPFEQEEARIFIEPKRVGLLGDDDEPIPGVERKGTYFAVLEFTRKKLGVRWIWPGELGEVYTPQPTLALTPEEWRWKPDIPFLRSIRNGYRFVRNRVRMEEVMEKMSASRGDWERLAIEHDAWLDRARMNPSRMRTFGHAFSKWWSLYGEQHPEWFALPPPGVAQSGSKNSKLNLSSREVQDKIFNDWWLAWKEDPEKNRTLNISPNDGRGFDTRPETRAWDAPELASLSAEEIYSGASAVLSDRYVRFANLLAKRVRAVDPDAHVATYAYRNYQSPPLTSILVEPNVIIEYCGGEGYYPDERQIIDEWIEWRRRGAQLCWRPNFLQTGHAGPYLFSRQLYKDFQTLRQHGLLGTDFDTLWGNWAGQGLVYYVLAELHSRPKASYEELAEEYFSAFGPAKSAIRAYHEYFEEVTKKAPKLIREHNLVSRPTWGGWWEAQIRVIPLFFSAEVLEKGKALIERIEKEAAQGTKREQQRAAMLVQSFRHSALMAEAFGKLRLQDPKVQVRDGGNFSVLKPLWDFRRSELIGLGQSYVTLFMEEQRALGLWVDYFDADQSDRGEEVCLTDGWTARPDPLGRGVEEHWYEKNDTKNDTSWSSIAVAKPWRRALAGDPDANVVWYQVSFSVPDLADTGERVSLRFDAIDSEAKIWVNGQLVAERTESGERVIPLWQEAFELDVTEAVRPGAVNSLMLRVESPSVNAGITGPVSMILRR